MARFFIFIESGLGLTDRAKLLLLPTLLTHPHVTAQMEKEDIQEAREWLVEKGVNSPHFSI